MLAEQDPIHPGQRWYSTAEPELGLGTILRVQGRTVQIVFAGSDTLRHYAIASAPLLRAAFPIGGQIRVGGRDWTIDACEHSGGLLRYRCGAQRFDEGELDAEQPVSQADSRMLAGRVDPSAQFELRRELLEYRADARRHPGWGVLGARIERIEHQLRIAALADRRDPVRLLLADEVGLGKTIEACLICARMLASERVQRVVLLVPDSLIHQWFIELRRRFNLEFAIYDEERCVAICEADATVNPFAQAQWLLAGIDWLATSPQRAEQLLAAGCDLALIDEAHHLQWAPDASSASYDFAARLAARAPHLLLLSATPAQLGQAGHFARLRLLDPARYADLDAFIVEQNGYVDLSRALEPLLQGAPLTSAQRAALLHACAEEATSAEAWIAQAAAGDAEARNHLLDALIDRHGTGRVMQRNRRALVGGFPTRIAHVQLLAAGDDPTLFGRLHAEYRHDAHALPGAEEPSHDYRRDPRMDWLLATLATIAPAKALLLCHSRAKVQALEDALRERSGIACARFHEDMGLLQRDRNAAWFADPDGARLLIASEAGAEGRNFQFAQHLILWDLPGDPDRLEQRIGRLDRIGQPADVQIHTAAVEGSAQAVLQAWYAQGLDAFAKTPVDGGSLVRACRVWLDAAIAEPSPNNVDILCTQSRALHEQLRAQVAQGRDHLLDLAAQRGDPHLLDALRTADQAAGEDDFPLRMLEHLGVQHEELGHGLYALDPEYLNVDGLDALREGPRQACLRHDIALARDDVLYLRADHPLIASAGDILLASERGNASCVVDELPARSAILEAIFIVQCVAAPGLDLGRWLPTAPLRIAIDTRMQPRADFALSARARLRAAERTMDLTPHRRLLAKLVPPLLAAAREHAASEAQAMIAQARAALAADTDARIERLQALARRNPDIGNAQIEAERQRGQRLDAALERAHVRLDALRLVVSPDLLAPPPRH